MNSAQRALIGALMGALLTLFAHPLTRPKLFSALLFRGPSWVLETAPEVIGSTAVLPQPTTLDDFALWMDAGARRLVDRKPTSLSDWLNLTRAAHSASELEPDNAFWPQMEAVFSLAGKDRPTALKAWFLAARRQRWDDRQSIRLAKLRNRLYEAYGSASWASCVTYPNRSIAPTLAIETFARDTIRQSKISQPDGLRLRFATLVNGQLMRDNARSIALGNHAVAIIEMASYPPDLSTVNSPRKLLLARAELYNALETRGLSLQAQVADRTFRDNDGWLSFPSEEEARGRFRVLAVESMVANGLVGGAMVAALLGGVIWLIGSISSRNERLLQTPWCAVFGVASALILYAATQSLLGSVALAASFAFLGFSPRHERSHPSLDLGPLHGFLLLVLGALLSSVIMLFVVGISTPGYELAYAIETPEEFMGASPTLGVIFGVGFGLVLLIAPAYAYVHRIGSATLAAHSLRRMGRGMSLGWVILSILAAPGLLAWDRAITHQMGQIVENEVVYYYVND